MVNGEFDLGVTKDPELKDDEVGCEGSDNEYDGAAVESIPYDHEQFELPDDFEVEEDDNG